MSNVEKLFCEESGIVRVIFEKSEDIVKLEGVFLEMEKSFGKKVGVSQLFSRSPSVGQVSQRKLSADKGR